MEPSEVTSERDPLMPNEPCVASTATPRRSLGKKKSGHILNSDSRNMILHCYTLVSSTLRSGSVEDTSKFVADMLGVSVRTVFRVREEVKASHFLGGKLTTPSRKRPRNAEKRRRRAKFDSFHVVRTEIPTVEEITTEFSERIELQSLRRCTVRRLLAEIGFKHEKRSRNSLLIDRADITDWRDRYLRGTWVTTGRTRSIVWTDTMVQKRGRLFARANGLTTGLKQPSGKGQRLIVTHIGSEDGFVDGCLEPARREIADDGLEEGRDTGVAHKQKHHLRGEDDKEAAALADNTAVRAGCIVLRLPPYHCEFNPIELVWAKVINGIAADNRDFKLSMVDAILREKTKQVTAEDWRMSIQHVMDLEAKFRLDTSGSKHIQPIIIQLDVDDTEESDSDCELSGIEPLEEA
ncbi:hypothetical protein HPB50_014276 [Hyalomma asiaticum]|uniref:Uncharacterized protein n=1 Tax=Hyalomma asiaticum TaxID=266040 RepID=A0ACB7S3L2_HYAAI|nr:hypothetical protein HPB50_014276 [Hyalomma asiaticum]